MHNLLHLQQMYHCHIVWQADCGILQCRAPTWLKCMSPMLSLAPSTNTGKYTLQPRLRFLMSQLPPFSRLAGAVRPA